MQEYYRSNNTNDAYHNKAKEFQAYCQLVCQPGLTQFALYTKKVYDFMFYQMMRSKKKVGERTKRAGGTFDLEEYNAASSTSKGNRAESTSGT